MTSQGKQKEKKIEYGFAEHQGKRSEMEDIHVIENIGNWHIFCICDGHGGRGIVDLVASTLKQHLLTPIVASLEEKKSGQWRQEIRKLFAKYDRYLYDQDKKKESGCTFNCVLYNTQTQTLILINLGDSRSAVLCNQKEIHQTIDQKPASAIEQKRISLAHGCVSMGRVNGVLAVARALGDFSLKTYRQLPYDPVRGCVSAIPDVFVFNTSSCNTLDIVLACDGIWDVLSSNDLFNISLISSSSVSIAAQTCLETAYALESSDNMSIFVISIR